MSPLKPKTSKDAMAAVLASAADLEHAPLPLKGPTKDVKNENGPIKFPKAVKDLHGKLDMTKGDVNLSMIKTTLGKAGYNNFTNNFRNSLSEMDRGQYNARSPREEEDWVLQWALDPVACKTSGFNKKCACRDEGSLEDEGWYTVDQLGSARWFNNPGHAKLVCDSGELESRPSRFKALADTGVKEFRTSETILRRLIGVREENGVEAETDLTADEFAEVKQSIQVGARIAKRKAPTKQKIDPAAKALKEMNSKKARVVVRYAFC